MSGIEYKVNLILLINPLSVRFFEASNITVLVFLKNIQSGKTLVKQAEKDYFSQQIYLKRMDCSIVLRNCSQGYWVPVVIANTNLTLKIIFSI